MVGKIKSMMMKTKWYPQPHDARLSFFFKISNTSKLSTIIPLAMYDEGLGTPSANETHPENANFAEDNGPNCFVESRVNNILTRIDFQLTKETIETDKLPAVKIGYMPIFLSFKEDYIAIDELSSKEVQDVYGMQTESTDRQGYPLWNATKLVAKFTNSANLGTNVPGLTTTQVLEAVVFDENAYFDAIHYMTISGKVKATSGGIRFVTLSRFRNHASIDIKMRSKVKRMNPYTFFGVIIFVPHGDSFRQLFEAGDALTTDGVQVNVHCRFNEWNQDFNFKKV